MFLIMAICSELAVILPPGRAAAYHGCHNYSLLDLRELSFFTGGGGQNFLGWSKGRGSFFFSRSKGGKGGGRAEFSEGQRGGGGHSHLNSYNYNTYSTRPTD